MTTLADLHDEVAEVAPGATSDQVDNRIFEVFRYFCSRTSASQQEIDQAIVSGTDEYTITPPTGYLILNVQHIKDDEGAEYDGAVWDKVKRVLTLDNEPASDFDLTLTCALVPVKGADQTAVLIPDNIEIPYRESLIMGAQGKLLLMLNQSWSNASLGSTYYQALSGAIDESRIDAVTRRGRYTPRSGGKGGRI